MKYLRIAVGCIFALSLGQDARPPRLQRESDCLELSVSAGSEALPEGLSAYDEIGGLTNHIIVTPASHFPESGTCKVKYAVFHSRNNSATLLGEGC